MAAPDTQYAYANHASRITHHVRHLLRRRRRPGGADHRRDHHRGGLSQRAAGEFLPDQGHGAARRLRQGAAPPGPRGAGAGDPGKRRRLGDCHRGVRGAEGRALRETGGRLRALRPRLGADRGDAGQGAVSQVGSRWPRQRARRWTTAVASARSRRRLCPCTKARRSPTTSSPWASCWAGRGWANCCRQPRWRRWCAGGGNAGWSGICWRLRQGWRLSGVRVRD